MTTQHPHGTVLPVEDLLARIRACIVGTAAIVSLTINIERSGETTVFRLNMQPDGSLVALSAEELPSSPPTELGPLTSITPPPSTKQVPPRDTSQHSLHKEVEDERHLMEVDESDEAKRFLCSASVHQDDTSTSDVPSALSSHSEPDSTIATSAPGAEPPSHSNNIRRSARQQHPPDRLAYPPAAPALNAAADPRIQRAKRAHKTSAIHAGVQEWTEAEASDSSLSSCERSIRSHRQHKKRRVDTFDTNDHLGEEEQIAALVLKLKEGYWRRQEQKQLDMENVSKQAILQLWREVAGNKNAADTDALTYPQYARKIDLVISVSTGLRMVGYYLRAVLAARLKCSHKTKYVRSARIVLGLKSSADIAAYPAFYSYIQEHCPSIAAGGANAEIDIDAWLQEPIFLADIGWLEWRRLLGKPHRWILDTAMEQFTASLQPAQDWMQRGWVEEYDDVTLGRGVRAVRDIPLRTSKGDSAAAAADLAVLSQASNEQESAPWYCFEWNSGKQQFDAEHHWVGRINHLPMPHCNLKLMGNGKLMQRKFIAVGEALTFDYGVEWWTHRVTGVSWKEWLTTGSMSRRKGSADLFTRMHESVLDYTLLLSKEWDKRLNAATSELEREQVLLELWEDVAPSEEQERERLT